MENTLLRTLISLSEKLRNNFPDEGTLERNLCLLSPEVHVLAEFWGMSAKEALILAGIILWNTEYYFEQCTFQDLARSLNISNLELTSHYAELEKLRDNGWVVAEEVQLDHLHPGRLRYNKTTIKPVISQYGYRYYPDNKVVAQLFLSRDL